MNDLVGIYRTTIMLSDYAQKKTHYHLEIKSIISTMIEYKVHDIHPSDVEWTSWNLETL